MTRPCVSVCSVAPIRLIDGDRRNEVKAFEVVGIDKPEPDAFAPADMENEDDKKENDVSPDEGKTPF